MDRGREERSMRYLLLVCWDAGRLDEDEEPAADEPAEDEDMPWLDELRSRDAWVIGDRLAPPRRARSVRSRGGKVMVTDGPFAETKEAIGGFDIIEASDLDEAVRIAAEHPVAATGTIEVRPFWGT